MKKGLTSVLFLTVAIFAMAYPGTGGFLRENYIVDCFYLCQDLATGEAFIYEMKAYPCELGWSYCTPSYCPPIAAVCF